MSTSSFERDNSELTPITASLGFNDGANKGFWRIQPRAQVGRDKGQWIEMGAEIRTWIKNNQGLVESIIGRALGSTGDPNGIRFRPNPGYESLGLSPDKIYGVDTNHVEKLEGSLSEEYLRSQGIEVPKNSTGDMSTAQIATVPTVDQLESADVTPDDIRLANDGIDSPEGQEMSKFKDSEEGQAIARLDEETAATVQQGIADAGPNSDVPNLTDDELRKIIETGVDLNTPGSFERERAASAEWMARSYGDKRDPNRKPASEMTDEELKAAYKGAFMGGEAGPIYNRKESSDVFKEFGKRGFTANTIDEPATPTGDKALEELGYTKTGVDPDRDEWASEGQIEAGSGLPSVGISKQDDGTWETVNYETGEIFPGATKDESIANFYEAQRDATPEEIAAAEAEDKAKDDKAEADRQAAMAPKQSKNDFVNGIFDRIESRAEGVGSTGEKPVMPSKEAIDEAYDNYSSDYDMARNSNEDVDYDYNQMLMDDAVADLMDDAFPVSQLNRELEMDDAQRAMDKAVNDAMNGGDPKLDNLINEARTPSTDDDEEINLDEFDEADGIDELDDSFVDTSDPEFQQSVVAKENVGAEDLQMDDFISVGGKTLKVVGLQYNDDDSVTVRAANADGFIDEFERSDYNLITKFGDRGQKPKATPKSAPEVAPTPAPKPAAKAKPKATPKAKPVVEPTPEPEVVPTPTPAPAPAPTPTAELPGNATKVKDVNDLQYGDILYTQDGLELGKFLGIESKGPSGTTVKISKNGTIRPVTLTGRKPLFMTREEEEMDATPEVDAPTAEAPKEPTVTKGKYKSKRVNGEAPKAPEKTTPAEKERPQEIPLPPAERIDDGESLIDFEDANPTDPKTRQARMDRLRSDKVLPQFDQFGNPLFLSDSNNQFILDSNGDPVPLTDEEAFRGLLYEFYPNAKTTADGMRTILVREKDGDDTFEISVSRSNGGSSIIEVRITDAEGNTQRYQHYDARQSFAGLHGLTNSPQMIYDILTGAETRKVQRLNTANVNSVRERLEYFRLQKRRGGKVKVLSTPEELWQNSADGQVRIINKSKGGRGANKGKAYMTLQQRELAPFWDAIDTGLQTGNFDEAYFRGRRFTGTLPLDLDSLVEFRGWLVNNLRERFPALPSKKRGTLATTISNQLRTGVIETKNRRERPFMSADGSTPIRPGQWGYYTNSDGVKSYGRVVERQNSVISNPKQVDGDFQYRDNLTIEFNGQVVTDLASKFFRVLDDPEQRKRRKEAAKIPAGEPKNGTLTNYVPSPMGEERIRLREAELAALRDEDVTMAGPGDGVSEDQYQANLGSDGESGEEFNVPEEEAGSSAGGAVGDLQPGDTLFSKSGDALGPVFGIQPITSKSGKAGFRIAYVDEDGDVQTVNVAADEVRSPKA
jgi:hypothetical protein